MSETTRRAIERTAPGPPEHLPAHQTPSDEHSCDATLRASPQYDPFHCKPEVFVCTCGRRFLHVCDEAEGCFWTPNE